ncbi:MAG: archease, partial [Armatimonadetes bacterium]|nr:archease [Armatimonadota bacterium]
SSDACPDCANCKLDHLTRLRSHFRRIIYIGDGHSDLCAARHADVVFAKSHLAEILSAEGRPFLGFENLSQVAQMLAGDTANSHCAGFEVLDHPADYAIRAWGHDLSSLISATARGMLSFVADTEGLQPADTVSLTVEAEIPEYLVHHCLRELLYLAQDGQIPVTVTAHASESPPSAELRAGVVPATTIRDRLRGEIKAVTYHNLAIRRDGGLLSIEVVFDT